MNHHRQLIALGLALSSILTAHAAAPANDSASSATLFTTAYQSVTGQNLSLGTASTTDPLINGASAGRTLWYRINGTSGSFNDSWTVEVRSTTAVGKLAIYDILDPENPLTSLVQRGSTASFSAGQTVRLTVTSYSNMPLIAMVAGTGTFDLVQRGSLTNDFPLGATNMPGNKGTLTANSRRATFSPDEPASIGSNTVWFKWTPTTSAPVSVDTNFSFVVPEGSGSYTSLPDTHDTYLAVFTGTPDALVPLVADNDSGWKDNSLVSFTTTAGTTYYISVGTQSGAAGEIVLNYYPTTNAAGEFYFPGSSFGASYENADSHECVVRRRYAGAFAGNCLFTTTGGTATAASDYQSKSASISFTFPSLNNDDAWEQIVPVNLINDTVSEASETVGLVLSNPPSNGSLGLATASFTIVDDDTDNNSMAIGIPVIRVKESAGTLYNTVIRTGNTGSQISLVQYPLEGNSSATLNDDVQLPTTNTIAAGSTMGTLSVNIVDDKIFEGEEEVIQLYVNVPGYPTYKVIIEDDDPFIPVAGRLVTRLFYSNDSRAALINATVSSTGAITGKAMIPGQTLSFKAQFDLRGHAATLLYPAGRTPLALSFQAVTASGACDIYLTDPTTNDDDYDIRVPLITFSATTPCPHAGRYTILLDSFTGVSCAGAMSASINSLGVATLSGRLFDGTAITSTGYATRDNDLDAAISLYSGKGMLSMDIGLPDPLVFTTTSGSADLTRPARAGDATKLGAVLENIGLKLCRYSPPTSGQRALDAWSTGTGHATLQDGALPSMLTKTLSISTANLITVPADANQLKLSINPTTGIFTGSLIPTAGAKPLSIYGALLDQPTTMGYGQGFFFDGLKGGIITIGQ